MQVQQGSSFSCQKGFLASPPPMTTFPWSGLAWPTWPVMSTEAVDDWTGTFLSFCPPGLHLVALRPYLYSL